jgi:transposase-like protein
MIVDMTFPHHSYDDMSVTQLAQIRDYGLDRVQTVTEVMKIRVREEAAEGAEIKKLAKQAGVTRQTIYSWLSQ